MVMKPLEAISRPLSRDEALGRVPVKNHGVSEFQGDNGALILSFQITLRPWFSVLAAKLSGNAPKMYTKKIELDTMGAQVWQLIDGRRPVRGIIREFGEIYQLHPREAEVSVTQFLRMLGKKGLIGIQ